MTLTALFSCVLNIIIYLFISILSMHITCRYFICTIVHSYVNPVDINMILICNGLCEVSKYYVKI